MKTPSKALYDQVKAILKRVPGEQRLSNIIHDILWVRELSGLINEKRIVVFHPYFMMEKDVELTHKIVHEVVKEFFDVYGSVRLRRTTAAIIKPQDGTILLYTPLALLEIPPSHEEYLQGIERETRREIHFAERLGYEFREFVWNDHLDDIFEINTSKEVRQSEPMRGWYREPVQPRYHSSEELQYRKYYGAFKDGKLYAYFHFYKCGDLAIGKHFIGHAQHLKYGIMNGLISWTVRKYIEIPQIRWWYYGDLKNDSLGAFKKHAGFQKYAVLLDLEYDRELLKYSDHTVRTLWHV